MGVVSHSMPPGHGLLLPWYGLLSIPPKYPVNMTLPTSVWDPSHRKNWSHNLNRIEKAASYDMQHGKMKQNSPEVHSEQSQSRQY